MKFLNAFLRALSLRARQWYDDILFGFLPGGSFSWIAFQEYINFIDWAGIVNAVLIGFMGGMAGLFAKVIGQCVLGMIKKNKSNVDTKN